MNIKHIFFKSTFFPSTIIEWNKLDPAIRNSTTPLKKASLSSKIPKTSQNHKGTKYFTRLRWTLAAFVTANSNTHFKTINPLCTCSLEAETNHFIFHCSCYENERHILLACIRRIKSSILNQNDNNIVKTLLYGLGSRRETQKRSILNATMEFLISSNRFEEHLY